MVYRYGSGADVLLIIAATVRAQNTNVPSPAYTTIQEFKIKNCKLCIIHVCTAEFKKFKVCKVFHIIADGRIKRKEKTSVIYTKNENLRILDIMSRLNSIA